MTTQSLESLVTRIDCLAKFSHTTVDNLGLLLSFSGWVGNWEYEMV